MKRKWEEWSGRTLTFISSLLFEEKWKKSLPNWQTNKVNFQRSTIFLNKTKTLKTLNVLNVLYDAIWWAVEGLGLLLLQGHSRFREFRMPCAQRESNPAYFRAKPSVPYSHTTTPIQFIRHCFQLLRSYTSLTYLCYVVLTFQLDILLWHFWLDFYRC